MRVAGLSTSTTETSVVILDEFNQVVKLLDIGKVRKVELADHTDSESLRSYSRTLRSLLSEYKVESVRLRQGSYKGQKRTGAPALKAEAIIQSFDLPVVLVPAATCAVRLKKPDALHLKSDLYTYQHDALGAALTVFKPESS